LPKPHGSRPFTRQTTASFALDQACGTNRWRPTMLQRIAHACRGQQLIRGAVLAVALGMASAVLGYWVLVVPA
jgi:hypothetical protein